MIGDLIQVEVPPDEAKPEKVAINVFSVWDYDVVCQLIIIINRFEGFLQSDNQLQVH
jgi:hypothetical protein